MPSLDPSAIDALPHHRPEAILAHSRFGEARRLFVEGILGLYEHDSFLTRLLTQAARSVVFFTIVCLHSAHDEADRDTWPTMRLLQGTVAHFGLSSPRRVQDIVGRLVQTGYLASSPAPLDRRARLLRPSPKMLAHDLDWLAAYYRPLDALFPDPGYGPPLRRDPEFQRAQRVVGLEMSLYSARLLAANPAFMLFLGRDAGAMILIKLVQLSRSEEGRTARRISFADFGKRFGISRTHVRELLRDAERAGLVRMADGDVALNPPLVEAFDRFVADTLAAQDLSYREAMRRLGGAAGPDDAGLRTAMSGVVGA